MENPKIGTLEVITGSMFSGKSEELIRRLRRAKFAKQKVVTFKHSVDNRYGENGVFSHRKESIFAYPVKDVAEMEKIMDENIDAEIIGIDEVQFFGDEIVDFCKKYVNFGKRVIVAGLDLSFRAEPYEPVPELMAIADEVDKLHAICTVCGKPAYASQRLLDGKPAYYEDPLVMVGTSENYEARCKRHFIINHRNEKKAKIYFFVGTEINVGKKFVEEMYIKNLAKHENIKSETIILSGNILNCEKNALKNLRKKVGEKISKNDFLFVRITGGILLPIEKNYTILDFMCELRKDSEVVIVSKNKKGALNQILVMADLIKKSDLNLREIVYKKTSNNNEIEENQIIEKISKLAGIGYRMI